MMTRLLALLVVLMLSVASPQPATAGPIEECCLCVNCATGPEACVAPTIDCQSFCINTLNCEGSVFGQDAECTIGDCATPASAQAPTASHLGLAITTVALALVGLRRVTRRRHTAS